MARIVLVLVLTSFVATAGAGAALAEGPTPEERLARLEALLEAQAAEIARLRAEVEAGGAGPAAAHPPSLLEEPPPSARARPASIHPAASPPPGPATVSSIPTPPPAGGTRESRSGVPSSGPLDAALSSLAARARATGSDPLARAPGGLRWGGYLTLEYVARSDRNSYADLHRFVLQADTTISEGIDLLAEIEFEHGGIGGGLDGDVELEYLEVAFRVTDWFQPKVGALLIPFGRWNLYHDDPLNDFTMRPWVGRYLVPTGFGQPGIGVEGGAQVLCDSALTWNVAVTTGYDDGFSTDSGARGARQSWRGDNNESKQVWGRLALLPGRSPFDYVEVGLSGTWGRYDDADDHDVVGLAADFTVREGPFELLGEYVRYDLERATGDPDTLPRRQEGLLLQAAFHFFPSFLGCGRPPLVTDTSHFTLAVRYQWTDLNDRQRGGSFQDDLESWGVALNYRITEATVFRVDHTWFEAVGRDDRHEFTASFSTYF